MTRKDIFLAVQAGRGGRPWDKQSIGILDKALDALGVPRDGAVEVPTGRQPSKGAIEFIKSFEGLRLSAYMPTPRDRPTIGWGTTGPDVRMGMTWTLAQADQRFARDLNDFAAGVNHLLGDSPTTQNQFDALVSFAYNVGLDDDADTLIEGLGDSTLLRKHRAGDFAGAAAEFPRWNRQKGVVLRGLTRRRAAEAAMYLS